MTDPTEAIRRALEAFAAFSSATTLSALHLACKPSALGALLDRLDSAEAEVLEQARLNGMGAEREAALLARLDSAERERDALRDVYEAEKAVSRCFDEVSPGLSSVPSGHQERLGAAIERRKECVRKVEALRGGAVGGEGL